MKNTSPLSPYRFTFFALTLALLVGLVAACDEGSPSYKVSFNLNEGTPGAPGSTNPQTVRRGARASEPTPRPSRSGYTFMGWYSDAALMASFNFSSAIMANHTLYARWVENGTGTGSAPNASDAFYTVTFNLNGGMAGLPDNTAPQLVANGGVVKAPNPAPVWKDYIFDLWYADAALSTPFDFATLIKADRILYARWKDRQGKQVYIVTFDLDGGSPGSPGNTDPQGVLQGSAASEPSPSPTRAGGYTFMGWYSDAAFAKAFDFSSAIMANHTLYARWVENGTGTGSAPNASDAFYRVTFNLNGGAAGVSGSTDPQPVAKGKVATKPSSDPVRPHHTFKDWYKGDASTTPFDFSSPITSDLTLQARWISHLVDIPDPNFRAYLKGIFTSAFVGEQLDTTDVKVKSFRGKFNVYDEKIASLEGVEFFKGLGALNCGKNQLTELDVSHNVNLIELSCMTNQLTSLDVSKNTALTLLECVENQLASLDVSKNTALTFLAASFNKLTVLDVSKNTALENLYCSGNQLTSLDITHNTKLAYLGCFQNQLTSLDISQNKDLIFLTFHENQLTKIDLSQHTKLTDVWCWSNQLTTLDVSQSPLLENLRCSGNQLTSLDVHKNTALTTLECGNNPLRSLDMRGLRQMGQWSVQLDVKNLAKVGSIMVHESIMTNNEIRRALQGLYNYTTQRRVVISTYSAPAGSEQYAIVCLKLDLSSYPPRCATLPPTTP